MTSRAVREAEAIYEWAHTLLTHVRAAEQALDTAQAGWPTSTPGSAPAEGGSFVEGWCDELTMIGAIGSVCGNPLPCPDHPTPAQSIVERTAGTDRARRVLEKLREYTHTVASNGKLQFAAKVAQTYGVPSLDKTTIANRLVTDADIYCQNCVRHGHKNPRIDGERFCSFCGDFRRNWITDPGGKPVDAPKEVLDLRAAKGNRLSEADVIRNLDRLGIRWKRPKQPKAS